LNYFQPVLILSIYTWDRVSWGGGGGTGSAPR
jgi:hypothetical protein